jgi:hypothetical protein
VGSVLETLRINLVDALGPRRTCREPAAGGNDLESSKRSVVAGGFGQPAVIGSPASDSALTDAGESFSSFCFCSAVEQIGNRNGEIVVRLEQPMVVTDYPMAISIGVACESYIESVPKIDHTNHGVR